MVYLCSADYIIGINEVSMKGSQGSKGVGHHDCKG